MLCCSVGSRSAGSSSCRCARFANRISEQLLNACSRASSCSHWCTTQPRTFKIAIHKSSNGVSFKPPFLALVRGVRAAYVMTYAHSISTCIGPVFPAQHSALLISCRISPFFKYVVSRQRPQSHAPPYANDLVSLRRRAHIISLMPPTLLLTAPLKPYN